MKYSKDLLDQIFENRSSILVIIEGEFHEIKNTEFLNQSDIESIEDICESYEDLNERVQIKRKYRDYPSYQVNKGAPIRNRIVEFVGNRFITEDELKNFLIRLEEERGNSIDQRKWFSRNQKYFESFQNRGQKVWTLSKFGKRVFEYIIKAGQQKQINESAGLFKF
jgi:hypothetical protein